MKFKAVIFDFDGLMFDTESIWRKYFFEANKVFNTNFTKEDLFNTIGKNEKEIRKYLKSICPDCDVNAFRDYMREHAFNHFQTRGVKPMKGLNKILKYTQKNNFKIGIASGSESKVISKICEYEKVDISKFQSIVAGEMKLKPKPNPDVFLKVCEDLGVDPHEAVVLEDSYNGVRAGHAAGCYTIMIPDTLPVTDEMEQMADLILKNLKQVIKILNKN